MPDAGDVVTVDFTGATGIKRRPAVVISSRLYHQHRPDLILGSSAYTYVEIWGGTLIDCEVKQVRITGDEVVSLCLTCAGLVPVPS